MLVSDAIRILMYSHDTYGLGHLTRTLRIARAIRRRTARASILVLSGSPVAPYVPLPPGADLVKMPSVLKAGPEKYQSLSLAVKFSQIKKMRRNVIRSTAVSFRPHVFMVDNVPLGMKGEVLPTLEMMRKRLPASRVVLNLRDILDDPEVIRESWNRTGVPEILRSFYDQIYVLGDAEVFDAARAYGLPADRTLHVGYATPSSRRIIDPSLEAPRLRPRILLTAGGGGDGFQFLRAALRGASILTADMQETDPGRSPDVQVVTGPLMRQEQRLKMAELARECGARIEEFVTDLPERMADSDIVAAMAGYNTSCDILSHGHAALFYPRITPRVEQLIRTQTFESLGISTSLPSDRLDPEGIAGTLKRILRTGPRIDDGRIPKLGGLQNLADHFSSELVPKACGDLLRSRTTSSGESPRTGTPGKRHGFKGENGDFLGHDMSAVQAERVWYWPDGASPDSTR